MYKATSFFLLLFGLLMVNSFAQDYETEFVVSKDGSGDFTTVQEAVLAVPDFRDKETTMLIKRGVYKENLYCHSLRLMSPLLGKMWKR